MMVLLPALLDFIGLAAHRRLLLTLGGHGVLVVFLLLGLSVLYRIGPCRRAASWAWVLPGAFLATFLWVGSSALFSWYVANLAGYDALYGPLGAVAGVLMWFWITIYAVLLGAEMNSELELQTAADTTGAGRPPGERGAFVADHVAGS
jgi:membrane protein